MSAPLRFYNPREASPEILEAILVGREEIVGEILDDLSRQAVSSSRQHWLIRGPRGIGKTHLVGILYHRLRADERLSRRFLPVWLAETDAYSVYSAAMLLLQIAERLAEELDLAGDPQAEQITARLADLAAGGDDPALFEEVCEILKHEAQACGKVLVILMENLDALLAGLPGQRGAQEVRRLRSLLSHDKELLFVSTTPTRYLAAVSDPGQPLYGHLKERSLQPLTEEQVGELLERLAEVTGQTERLAPLREEREGRIRRRVLHRLTGGNPRAVVMAFTVLSGASGVQAMVEEMSALLDTQTAYFEARLAQLAPRERAILGAMALAPENLTLQEISSLTRLPLRSLSVQIDRLREHGYLSTTAGDGGKGTIYEVSDGLFRIWYQYRKGRKVLKPLVELLALWYADEELESTLLTLRALQDAALLLSEREVSDLSTLQVREALSYSRSTEGRRARAQLWSTCTDPGETREAWLDVLASLDRLPHAKEADAWKFLRADLVRSTRPEARWLSTALTTLNLDMKAFADSPETVDQICSALDAAGFPDLTSGVKVQYLLVLVDCWKLPEAQRLFKEIEWPRDVENALTLKAFSGVTLRWHSEPLPRRDHLLQVSHFVSQLTRDRDSSTEALATWLDGVETDRDAVLRDTFPVLFVRQCALGLGHADELGALLSRPRDETSVEYKVFHQHLTGVLAAEQAGRARQPEKAIAKVPPELREAVTGLAQKARAFWRLSARTVGSWRHKP